MAYKKKQGLAAFARMDRLAMTNSIAALFGPAIAQLSRILRDPGAKYSEVIEAVKIVMSYTLGRPRVFDDSGAQVDELASLLAAMTARTLSVQDQPYLAMPVTVSDPAVVEQDVFDGLDSRVLWGEAVEGTAREILATTEAADDGGGQLGEASRFLVDLLTNRGAMRTTTIEAEAKAAGYSWATIRRAQKVQGIVSAKEGMHGGWVWRLPSTEAKTPKALKNAEDAQ